MRDQFGAVKMYYVVFSLPPSWDKRDLLLGIAGTDTRARRSIFVLFSKPSFLLCFELVRGKPGGCYFIAPHRALILPSPSMHVTHVLRLNCNADIMASFQL